MNLSYWESETWLKNLDYCIVGSGITGLSCALELRERRPQARILVLERGSLPLGASTRNAGFACYGSLTEILEDLETHSPEEVEHLVGLRYAGIRRLRERLGDATIAFDPLGGYEVFPADNPYEPVLDRLGEVNRLLRPIFGREPFELKENTFGLQGIQPRLVCNPMEGQLDPGKMMKALLEKAREASIILLNGLRLESFEDQGDRVLLRTDPFEFTASCLLLATNGFAAAQTGLQLQPARAQVLITEPVQDLQLRGSFHMDAGYYYFRNVGDRVLLGGGRNLDKAGETTAEFGQTALIQQRLETLLAEVILPGKPVKIASRWSGIMGVGPQKKPLIQKLSANVVCGVRLGGMGVAIGSHVGTELARLGLAD